VFEGLKWKLVERPILPIANSYIDALPFVILFGLLFAAGLSFNNKKGRRFRPLVQAVSFVFFIFVVHRCFCALRGWVFGIQDIGKNDLNAFQSFFVFVPLIAFTVTYGRVFCGWICPLGAVEELFFKPRFLRRFLTDLSPFTRRIKLMLLTVSFAILSAFLFILRPKTFVLTENMAALWGLGLLIIAFVFILNPRMASRLKRLRYTSLLIWLFAIMSGVFVTDPWCTLFGNEIDYSSILAFSAVVLCAAAVSMAWCRFLCPLGSFLGLFVGSSAAKVVRDAKRPLPEEALGKICYVEALGKDCLDSASCLYCGRCVDAGVSTVEER
jgi:polyferredoxin